MLNNIVVILTKSLSPHSYPKVTFIAKKNKCTLLVVIVKDMRA